MPNACTAHRRPRVAAVASMLVALLAVLALLAAALLAWQHGPAAMLARFHAWPGSHTQVRQR